jgi:3-deoxy-D-manno-octulosonic-acid transferase
MARLLYTLVVLLLMPWALLHLLWRSRRQPEYLRHWNERFGFFASRPEGPLIWIHAVSVGETRAAQPLVAALRARYPEHRIMFTHMTPTGRQTSIDLFADTVTRVYLPYDTPWAVGRFLDHFRPDVGLIMETELWPNLVAACHRRNLPLLLINGRLSERSASRYARFPALTREALQNLAAIAAQGENDARRLSDLGTAKVSVLGNMKFDVEPPPAQLALGSKFRTRIGDRLAFLCASTREGEEALILDAWLRMGNPAMLLVIVPRHPQRFDEVATLITTRGLPMQRRSDNAPVALTTQVWLGDSMGEMFAYYAASDAAFVGGSLLDFGSQNLIEPCAVGVPVLVGPSTYNFADAAREAIAQHAVIAINSAEELLDEALALLGDPQRRCVKSKAAGEFAARHRGATARTLSLIEPFIRTPR